MKRRRLVTAAAAMLALQRNARAQKASTRIVLPVREPKDLEGAFAVARLGGVSAVVLGPESALIGTETGRIAALAVPRSLQLRADEVIE
jgi:hypothetical protein